MEAKLYRLKHVPSGLYYQPHKHRGSNLSKRGKIYQTATHGLSSAMRYADRYKDKPKYQLFPVYVQKDSIIHKQYKDLFNWEEVTWQYGQLRAMTNLTDWIVEPVA